MMNIPFSNRITGVQPSAIREILKLSSDPDIISFAAGNPSEDAFPVEAVRGITEEILAEHPIAALQYSLTEGYPALRQTLKNKLLAKGIGRENEEILVMSGAQQGIELATKCLVNEDDVVICEDPSFVGALNTFRSYGAKLVGVEMEPDGIHLGKLEQALRENPNTKLIYLIPTFQNPSGITTSLEKRKACYELAKRYHVMILEDNPYSDLRTEGEEVAPIKTFDEEGIVIYCGTFSKILSPGLRVGYVMVNKELAAKMTVAKQTCDVHSTILSQMICERFLNTVDFEKHLDGLRAIYRHKKNLMLGEMDKYFPQEIVSYTRPEGGLFIWCTFQGDVDSADFAKQAVLQKIAVVPGSAFLADDTQKSGSFRMNFSTPRDEDIVRGVRTLAEIIRGYVK